MTKLERCQRAKEFHEKGLNCGQAVLLAFTDVTGLTEQQSMAVASGFGGGLRCGGVCGVAFCGIQLARSLILLGNGTFPSGKCGVVGFLCLSKLGGESRKFLVGGILLALCCFRFVFRGCKACLSCACVFLCSSQRLLFSKNVALRFFKLRICLVQRLCGLRYGVLSVFHCLLLFENALFGRFNCVLCFCLFRLCLYDVLLRCCCRLLLC